MRAIDHLPVAFELSRGCATKCWFCALSAEPLTAVLPYNAGTASLWRDVLNVVKELLGPPASSGLCYWATDPLDNPDYESFARDFHEILGRYPQTTTARALADPARTRRLIATSHGLHGAHLRFSVLSEKQLTRINATFTAEQLQSVELVVHAPGGVRRYRAGRAREVGRSAPEVDSELLPGTAACLSGFRINLVDKIAWLTTPAPPDDRWPTGSYVLAQGTFADAESLATLLRSMIDRRMADAWPAGQPLKLRPDLVTCASDAGVELRSAYATHTLRGGSLVRAFTELVAKGQLDRVSIARNLRSHHVDQAWVDAAIALLYRRGLLDELGLTAGRLPASPGSTPGAC